ncbi:MAG: DUF7674 family protein [Fimbriiglobus sp.]
MSLALDRHLAVNVLSEACPECRTLWQSHPHEFYDEYGGTLLYTMLSQFARHMVKLLEQGDALALSRIFAAVEYLEIHGEHYVREAMMIGLLESVQNTNLHPNGTDPDDFREYVGIESSLCWDYVIHFWEGNLNFGIWPKENYDLG